MLITDVSIYIPEKTIGHLLAFCQIVVDDCMVIKDIRILNGEKSKWIAMPSRKIQYGCPYCKSKNNLKAKFCNDCGKELPKTYENVFDRRMLYDDVAHPINPVFRNYIEEVILAEYERLLQEMKQHVGPG